MSTSSPTADRARLIVDGGGDQVEIQVLNANLDNVPLQQNVGRVDERLPIGSYIVRFRAGNQVSEQSVVLPPGGERTVRLERPRELKFETAAPVQDALTATSTHQKGAKTLSRSPAKHPLGQGDGHLVLFARDPFSSGPADLSRGLSLRTLEGKLVCRLEDEAKTDRRGRWAGMHLGLPPASYRLRYTVNPTSFTEQIVLVCPGWQTQVFLMARPGETPQAKPVLDPTRVSVLFARPTVGFAPKSPHLRWTEAALKALEGGRHLDRSRGDQMLFAKFENPMLGLYAAVAQLQDRSKISIPLMTTVFENLLKLLGPVPDVLAIGWALIRTAKGAQRERISKRLQAAGPVSAPPMLRASWAMLLEAHARQGKVIASGSFAERTAGRSFLSSAWLVWRVQAGELEEEASIRKEIEAARSSKTVAAPAARPGLVSRIVDALTTAVKPLVDAAYSWALGKLLKPIARVLLDTPEVAFWLQGSRHTHLERRLARYITPLADPTIAEFLLRSKGRPPGIPTKPRIEEEQLIKDMRLPESALWVAAWGLYRKLVLLPLVPSADHLEKLIAAESQGQASIRRVLSTLKDAQTPLRHRVTGSTLNHLQFVYVRYKAKDLLMGSKTSVAALARLLEESGYVFGEDSQRITTGRLGWCLSQTRRMVRRELRQAGDLHVSANWIRGALPDPRTYKSGRLFKPMPTPPPPAETSGRS